MKQAVKLLVLCLLLTGCASRLRVVVKVADRKQVIANADELKKHEVIAALVLLEEFLVKSDEDKTTIINNIEAFKKAKKPDYKPDNKVMEAFANAYDQKIAAIRADTDNARASLDQKKYDMAYVQTEQANAKITDYVKELRAFEITVEGRKISDNVIKDTKLEETHAEIGTVRTRFPILGDPLTSYIALDANKKILWKSVFNKTAAFSLIGNSDVAFILRSNPPEREMKSGDYNNNFTIKGVRMDASDATNAMFTGLTQTMNFIANTQGFSVPQPTTPDSNSPVPSQSPLVTGLDDDKATYEKNKKKLEDCKAMLIRKIELENIQGQDEDHIDAALNRILEHWEALKTKLNTP